MENITTRKIENFFKIKERGSTISTELIAGLTTFMSMAYVLAVVPNMLALTGMDQGAVFVATAISAGVATLLMGFMSNLPIALAPGMGTTSFFAFTVVLGMGYSWQFALTAVFLEGLLFIILTLTRFREALIKCIPLDLKYAISAGIGLFIAFIGLQSSGIIVKNDATFVSIGDLTTAGAIVAIIGMALIGTLLYHKVRGALLIGILLTTVVSIPLGISNFDSISSYQLFSIPSIMPTFWQFDFSMIFTLEMLIIVFTFLLIDLFDTLGTLVGVCAKGNLFNDKGELPQAKTAFLVDAIGTTGGAILGVSTVTSYIESASGIAEGGRTGLTALTTASFFILALFLAPIFLLVPMQATAPVLILVGLFMISSIKNLNFDDYVISIPAFLIIIGMPLTFSIANGIGLGIISYVFMAMVSTRIKEVHPITYFLAIIFIWKFLN